MRRIILSKIQVGEQEINVAKVISDAIQVTPIQHFSLGEIRTRAKVLDVLEASFESPYLDMEDSEWENLKRALTSVPYGSPGVRIDVRLFDKILGRVLDAEPTPTVLKPIPDNIQLN